MKRADVDMNVVMKTSGEFIEIQGTGEKKSFPQDDLNSLLFKDILPSL